MKVGFVVECGPDGADYKVIDHLVRKLRPTFQPQFVYGGMIVVLHLIRQGQVRRVKDAHFSTEQLEQPRSFLVARREKDRSRSEP